MATLRELSRTDTAIGAISEKKLRLISQVLLFVCKLERNLILRWFIPKELREQRTTFDLSMLAANLGRTSTERVPLQEQIRVSMEENK